MARRFYFVPTVDDTFGRRPQFTPALSGACTVLPYGQEPTVLLSANVTDAEHTAFVAHAEVIAVPANLDAAVGGNLSSVQTALESINIPGGWITAAMTYRGIFHWTVGLFLLLQWFRGLGAGRLFALGLTLNSLVSDIPLQQRQTLLEAARERDFDISTITLSMTIKAALIELLNQVRPAYLFAGETL